MSAVQILDPITLPLLGARLIEASAGTGKTYTIAALYLRLLLGLGEEAAFPRPLGVDQILVVTFTEAATQELRGRIRANIHALRLACVRGSSTDPFLNELLQHIPQRDVAASMLLAAEQQMDDAAIYTIHGFCQRILTQHALEAGGLFKQNLLQNEYPLYRQVCADFWRRHCYPLPYSAAKVVSQLWAGPDALLHELSAYLSGDLPELKHAPAAEERILSRHQQNITAIAELKQNWSANSKELLSLISDSAVDKRSYSKSNLPRWLEKITQWAVTETDDYQLPAELERFRQSVLLEKTKQDESPRHPLFEAIDQLYACSLTIKDVILTQALSEIRYRVQQEKQQKGEVGFDDLISKLDRALHCDSSGQLRQDIVTRYPVAMIDEFQDTDPQQYRIFHTLYGKGEEHGLLLIGDPKQAIYAFRGADIFTYLRARREITEHYTLSVNWRSSPGMVAAVNQLFHRVEYPFLFQQIPFYPVAAATANSALCFEYQGQQQPALTFWLQPGEAVSLSAYQQLMARQCAGQIRDWLNAGQQGHACLTDTTGSRRVSAADITVLVRSGGEATLIRDALYQLGIPSVYLSNRDSVFTTPEARDLLWLLQAVVAPEREKQLRNALATRLLGLTAQQIYLHNSDEQAWDLLVEEFIGYRRDWQQRGVLPMLRKVLSERQLAEQLLAADDGERRLTDLLHLGELLQEASLTLESEQALIRWLAQQINNPDPEASNQQLRLESDRHLVQIVTIHKAKGLQYPLVCLPFIASFRPQQQALYHDRQTLTATLDLSGGEDALQWAEEERLAEDLRLLYVAVTRSIYHCSIGIAPLLGKGKSRQKSTDLHLTALGYLLQQGESGDAKLLQNSLQQLANEQINILDIDMVSDTPWQPLSLSMDKREARYFQRTLTNFWQVSSYSSLLHQGVAPLQELLPRFDSDSAGEQQEEAEPVQSIHRFPKGATAGSFLHQLLEQHDFSQPLEPDWLQQQLACWGYDAEWLPLLIQWMENITHTPLNSSGVTLAQLPSTQRQSELQFHFPIRCLLDAEQLENILRQHDPLSARSRSLQFQQVNGMLTGFIDLIFCWQGRYYLLDYKSNWLGDNEEAYTQEALEEAMCVHRYDLQYQIYTLALHRFLRHRLEDYHYQHHFGGVFYLFLRGMNREKPGQGVFYTRPAQTLVDKLDALFAGVESEESKALC